MNSLVLVLRASQRHQTIDLLFSYNRVVSDSDGKPVVKGTEVEKGTTGVELCWYEPRKFKKLTKEQKVELADWNKSNPNKDGTTKKRKAGEKNSKQSKAQNALLAAMVESQTAGLTAMNAKIASMTVGPTVGPSSETSVASNVTFSPQVMDESHEVLAEQARVASVRLQSILKPASKKEKKKNP